jgi:hypothetical protein
MKKEISPATFVSILVVALLVVGVLAWRTWAAPSSVPVTGGSQQATANPRAGGGPDAEALKKRDEYNRAHPEASKGH